MEGQRVDSEDAMIGRHFRGGGRFGKQRRVDDYLVVAQSRLKSTPIVSFRSACMTATRAWF